MVRKTYRTFSLRGLNLILKDVDGKRVEVIFRGGIQVDSTAKFTTSDEELQKTIESLPGFGRDYYLEEVREAQPEKEEPKKNEAAAPKVEKVQMTDVKDIRRFRNLVEMKNAMSELGIPVTQDMNYLAAKAAAQKEGYDFQIQK